MLSPEREGLELTEIRYWFKGVLVEVRARRQRVLNPISKDQDEHWIIVLNRSQ